MYPISVFKIFRKEPMYIKATMHIKIEYNIIDKGIWGGARLCKET